MQKGQINLIASLIGLGAMALTAFGFYTASSVRTDNKIGVAQKETTIVSERVAKVEEAIQSIKEDQKEIKADVKLLLKLIKE